jgi:hypothetical protein
MDQGHWRLPLNQDPDPEDLTDYALVPQTPKEEAERKKIITVTEAVSRIVLRCKHANHVSRKSRCGVHAKGTRRA